MNQSNRKLLAQMATPTRLGKTIGREYMGAEYVVFDWLLQVEKIILDALNDPKQRFIILNLPPQVGKSTFAMLAIAWYLGMNPMKQVIFVAYSEEYASSWGLKVRNLLQQYGPRFFGETVSVDTTSKSNWKMSNGFGGMLSAGIGGGITGNPGHLIWIDDVLKTMEEAASPSAKEKHLAEYDGAISSRFHDDTTVVITATRFAEDDLSGALIERQNRPGYEGDRFEVISIPAIAEPPEDLELDEDELAKWTDDLGRKYGDSLECVHSGKFFEQRRASLPAFVWSALYQQSPSVREGGMFPRSNWQYWSKIDPPRCSRYVRVWDLATTEGGGDWTVGSKWGLGLDGHLYLMERERVRRGTGAVENLVKRVAERDGYNTKILIEQEKAGAGVTVVENYQRLLRGYVVEKAKVEGTKEQRATPYSSMQQNKMCHLPADDPQLCKEWIDEHKMMMGDGRRPRHDDQIDTGAYAALDLLSQGPTDMFIPNEGLDSARLEQGFMRELMGESIFSVN